MKWIIPRSLSGQIAMVMTVALLAASGVNFALLWSERARSGLIEASGPAMARFVDIATDMAANPPPQQRAASFGRGGARFAVTISSQVDIRGLPRDQRLERQLVSAFEHAGTTPPVLRAAIASVERQDRMRGGPGPAGQGRGRNAPEQLRDMEQAAQSGPRPDDRASVLRGREIVLSAALPDGRWINGVFFTPDPPRGDTLRLTAGLFVLFAAVIAASLWIAARLSRPLNDLAAAAARVGAAAEPEEVAVRGPTDIQQTQEAFNAMSRRVSQLLNEKDVMLGALGHDLRTPLSSLRIRVESMEPESERQKAIRTIEEAARLLDDILELARRGRSSESVQTIDLSVLVEDIVEDYTETGAAIALIHTERTPVSCRPILFRRLLRNLIDNALTYGGGANVSVKVEHGEAHVIVEDNGPGMNEAELASATQPFVRGDESRSRSTGGAGLGLAIADAIARTHGGVLMLHNRPSGGLSASVTLPLAASPQLS